MNRLVYIFIALVTLLSFAPSRAAAETTVLFDMYNPPYMYIKKGVAHGLYPAIVTEVFARMGMPVTCKAVPWKRALLHSRQGIAAIGGLYKTEARKEIYDYSDPFYTERLMVFVYNGAPFDYKGLESLNGKTVGVLQGWSYGDEFDHACEQGLFKAIPVHADIKNFIKLVEGRIDCVIATHISALHALRELPPGSSNRISMLEPPMAINDTHLGFGKTANEKALLEKFNATLRQMKESGEYEELLEEYGVRAQDE